MQFNPIQTELTTAATDLLLVLAALYGTFRLRPYRLVDAWKVDIWSVLLLSLATASLLAAVAHGLVLNDAVSGWLWRFIYLCLGLVVSSFVVAAIYDLRGRRVAIRALPLVAAVVLLFFLMVQFMDGSFMPFIIFEGVAMCFALFVYGYLGSQDRQDGERWIAAGIGMSIVAVLIQAFRWGGFTFIWQFDHNSAYHLIQLLGLFSIILGLNKIFLAEKT
ncbi:MAG: hypothetical protein KZQ93_01590 [Candidatus Thiodiazotropha sp. (ex Monitilora ramsayi)]|nr:hypothetical protein [Candidatus Thiodiazotropha sp. (ex Monitilora ramsayi)]